MQRRVDSRYDVAEAFRQAGRAASQSKLQVRGMDLTRGGRMICHRGLGRDRKITDDADDFVPAAHVWTLQ